eukprot:COSAG03_NODE_851_length_5634_cov_2.593315_2_plen_122_part_00
MYIVSCWQVLIGIVVDLYSMPGGAVLEQLRSSQLHSLSRWEVLRLRRGKFIVYLYILSCWQVLIGIVIDLYILSSRPILWQLNLRKLHNLPLWEVLGGHRSDLVVDMHIVSGRPALKQCWS